MIGGPPNHTDRQHQECRNDMGEEKSPEIRGIERIEIYVCRDVQENKQEF